jgi:hypothetical protein
VEHACINQLTRGENESVKDVLFVFRHVPCGSCKQVLNMRIYRQPGSFTRDMPGFD